MEKPLRYICRQLKNDNQLEFVQEPVKEIQAEEGNSSFAEKIETGKAITARVEPLAIEAVSKLKFSFYDEEEFI